ncbi:hypothetical protein C0993_005952, partial [Termitomyces sp. T159_Od127]
DSRQPPAHVLHPPRHSSHSLALPALPHTPLPPCFGLLRLALLPVLCVCVHGDQHVRCLPSRLSPHGQQNLTAGGPVEGHFVAGVSMLGIGLIGNVDFVLEELVQQMEVLGNFMGYVGGDVSKGEDLSVSEQELVVGGEGEEAVVVGLTGGSGSGVMLSKEGVPEGVADLVQDTFFVHNQHGMKVLRWDYHLMVKCVVLHLKRLLEVHVWSPSEGIGLDTKTARVVVDGEVVFSKDFGPIGLAAAELLGRGEVLQIVVVQVDLDVMRGALEVGLPLLEGFNNGRSSLS